MSIEDLIKELESLKYLHGNLEVRIYDNDTDWLIPINIVKRSESDDAFIIKAESYSTFLQ